MRTGCSGDSWVWIPSMRGRTGMGINCHPSAAVYSTTHLHQLHHLPLDSRTICESDWSDCYWTSISRPWFLGYCFTLSYLCTSTCHGCCRRAFTTCTVYNLYVSNLAVVTLQDWCQPTCCCANIATPSLLGFRPQHVRHFSVSLVVSMELRDHMTDALGWSVVIRCNVRATDVRRPLLYSRRWTVQ